jgi:polysaccharide chain length determinant protein (PEP-CTERM system associated)
MSIQFRQRSASEYIKILKRRRWLLILPALSIFTAGVWFISGLPNYYESTTFLTLKPPTISEKVAPSLTDEDLSQRLQSISQTVLSRSSLEPMIAKFGLFENERASGMPIERMIEKMRSNIKVEPEKTDDEKTAGFRLTYRDNTPEAARAVTAELANKYVNVQLLESTQSAETTQEFINNQLSQARSSLDSLERERLQIMQQNVETLPESAQGLIAQLEGLRKREETISKDKETLTMERGRISESVRALNSQVRLIENYGEKETQEVSSQASRIEDTPAYAQLIQRRAELNGKLASLRKQYRDKHPEIVQAQTDIEKINDELEKLKTNTEQRVRQASQSSSRKVELQKQNLGIEKEKAESQILQIERQLQMKDIELQQNSAQIMALENKINAIPNVKVALEGIDTQYQTAKSNYDTIVKKYNEAQQQVQRESNAQGERIRVVDEANLPQTPANASKKPFFMAAGGGIGLMLGLILVAFIEVPRLFRIQTIEDTKYYTGLPVLASIPPLLSPSEISRQKRLSRAKVLMGAIIAVISVPLLVLALRASNIFDKLI